MRNCITQDLHKHKVLVIALLCKIKNLNHSRKEKKNHTLSLISNSLELFILSLLSELLSFFLNVVYRYLVLYSFLIVFYKFVLHTEICLHNCASCSKFDGAGGPLEDNQQVFFMVCNLLYKISKNHEFFFL